MKDKINNIKTRIKEAAISSGRNPEEIKLIAVSKKKSAEMILKAHNCGQTIFGENYIQEALKKIEQLSAHPIWPLARRC